MLCIDLQDLVIYWLQVCILKHLLTFLSKVLELVAFLEGTLSV